MVYTLVLLQIRSQNSIYKLPMNSELISVEERPSQELQRLITPQGTIYKLYTFQFSFFFGICTFKNNTTVLLKKKKKRKTTKRVSLHIKQCRDLKGLSTLSIKNKLPFQEL